MAEMSLPPLLGWGWGWSCPAGGDVVIFPFVSLCHHHPMEEKESFFSEVSLFLLLGGSGLFWREGIKIRVCKKCGRLGE